MNSCLQVWLTENNVCFTSLNIDEILVEFQRVGTISLGFGLDLLTLVEWNSKAENRVKVAASIPI